MDAHPYAPKDLSLPGFVVKFLPVSTLLGVFAVMTIIVVSLAWIIPGKFPLSLQITSLLIYMITYRGLLSLANLNDVTRWQWSPFE